jgi:ribonuclease P protein subunit RPR2
MNKHKQKKNAEKSIKILFSKAKQNSKNSSASKEYVRKALRQAMHFNLKLPRETRKKFCRKCLVYFNSENLSVRIKKGFIVMKCLDCNTVSKYKT